MCANNVAREAGDVDAVDGDGARAEVKHAQEGKQGGGLAGAGAAADGDLGAGGDGEGEAGQGGR